MSMNDSLASAFSKIETYERLGRKTVTIKPSSRLLKSLLKIMNENGYIGSYEENDDKRGGILTINLLGRINKCGVIKPRFPCATEDFKKYEKRYLLAKDFGYMFLSTSKGLMTHNEAKEKKIGGKLVAYCY